MQLTESIFGKHNGSDVRLFSLLNDNGMEVKIMTYGATITDIILPGGKSIACGFNTFEGYFSEAYKRNAPYFGCTVGRYCSQIKDARFIMNGKEYRLAKMVGKNNLHGGIQGFDKKMWKVSSMKEGPDRVGVELSLISKDLEEGFPGEVEVSVTMTLTNENEIVIDYRGIPTNCTPLSMTNHTYFNLSGFCNNILNHKATILSGKRQECDTTGAGTGNYIDVTGMPDDLRGGKIIGEVQKEMRGGFEHFYLTNSGFELKKVAEIEDPDSGTKLEVSTSEPCILLYTGKYTSDALMRESGEKYGQFRGLCLETHRYQNGPNIPNSPKTFTDAGEEFKSTTIFKLSW